LVLAVISALYEAGIIVRSLTSDGTSTNLKTYENLGCCLDPSNLKSSNFQKNILCYIAGNEAKKIS